ncbi:MAG: WG repeat-containing protein, partial [Bacteroidetes bacterium]
MKTKTSKQLFTLIVACLATLAGYSQSAPYPDYKEGKYGYKDASGKMIIPYQYKSAGMFKEGLAYVAINSAETSPQGIPYSKYGFIDTKGNIVIPMKYDNAADFSEGLASVTLNKKTGFIDKNDKVIIPFEYSGFTTGFLNGLAPVIKDGKYGVIDKAGKTVIDFKYEYIDLFYEGVAKAEKIISVAGLAGQKKCGYLDKTGKEVIPFEYEAAGSF